MARRYKKNEENLIFEIASSASWKTLFFLSFMIWIFSFFIVPNITDSNSLFKVFSPLIKVVSLVVIFIFVMGGLSKLILEVKNNGSKSDLSYLTDQRVKPSIVSRYSEHQINKIEPEFKIEERLPEWSLELIKTIDWKRFEDLCSAYFTEKKIRNTQTSLGADDGIDLFLYENNLPSPTAIVQCKRHTGVIGVTLIREFVGVMHHHKIHRGYFITTSSFNRAAIEFASSNNLKLVDGETLLSKIKELPSPSQDRLLKLITDGDYLTPTCVKCGEKMILKNINSKKFWGCRNFPRCRTKLSYKESEHPKWIYY